MTYVRRTKSTTSKKLSINQKIKANISVTQEELKSEHELQKVCVAKLRAHNMIVSCTDTYNAISLMRDVGTKAIYKTHMTLMGSAIGFPDLVIFNKGKATFVEFKFKKGKKSLEQEEWTKRLTEEGYECLEWRTIEDCTNWILNNTDLK